MSSQKSTAESQAKAKAPKRQRGRERVAQLLEAGAQVFAERGFDAATMTEIAARAGAAIGSLYQFFPNKELLADALVERYGEHIFEHLTEIEHDMINLSPDALTDALIKVFRNLAAERQLAVALLDARWRQPTVRPGHFRAHIRARLAGILKLWNNNLDDAQAAVHASIVLQLMKADIQLAEEKAYPGKKPVEAAWRSLLLGYLNKVKAEGGRIQEEPS